MDTNNIRFLTQQQRHSMRVIHQLTSRRRQIMQNIEQSMHQEMDPIMTQVQYQCVFCPKKFKGKQIGAHYRNVPKCKYMRDRPWLQQLPKDWQIDLQRFNQENGLEE